MFSNKLDKYSLCLFFLSLVFIFDCVFIPEKTNAQFDQRYDTNCIRHIYNPIDASVAHLTISIDNTAGSNTNNSSYCITQMGFVYFQFLIIFPVTSDTHQIRISLPTLNGPMFDQPATVGAVICPSLNKTIYADVTPATIVKFFVTGDSAAATYAELSGCEVAVSGIYYLH